MPMRANGPFVDGRARRDPLDMDEVECLIVRRVAVKMEQRQGGGAVLARHVLDLLIPALMIDQSRPALAHSHRFDGAEHHIVRCHRLGLDGAAIERHNGGGKDGSAGLERDPLAGRKPLAWRWMPLRPANRSASFSSPAPNVLTQNTPFWPSNGALELRQLRQTSSVAG